MGVGRFPVLLVDDGDLSFFVELAERVFVLGVTEHSITRLKEITDPEEIERLHRNSLAVSGSMDMFSSQMGTLEQLTKRIPSLFRDGGYRR